VDARRDLIYANWDAVLLDLKQLSAGCTAHGKWDYVQTVKHLDDWLRFPMDGFPKAPLPIAAAMWCLRKTRGPIMLQKIIKEGRMKSGVPTVPQTVHNKDPHKAAIDGATAQLLHTITRFQNHTGPIHESPVFGPMGKSTAEQLQWVHFSHHLSWLRPLSTADSTQIC
jgi:hypothetical protein